MKIFLILLLLLLAELLLSNMMLSVTHQTIENETIPSAFDGYKIVQLSDLHSKSFGSDNAYLLRVVALQKPDIIVLTGDMVNSTDTDFDTFYSLAQNLVEICPVYFILGNHEQMLSASLREELIDTIKSIGVIVMDNEKISLEKSGEQIDLYGLWFNLRYYRNLTSTYTTYSLEESNIQQLLGGKTENYTILLTHNPVYFKSYADWGADFTLSGHIHGGMIRIPFKGGLFSPEIRFFPEYDAGLYTLDDHALFVSRGLGNGLFGIRFLNHPQIAVFTLSN